jgi:hypothetical protein
VRRRRGERPRKGQSERRGAAPVGDSRVAQPLRALSLGRPRSESLKWAPGRPPTRGMTRPRSSDPEKGRSLVAGPGSGPAPGKAQPFPAWKPKFRGCGCDCGATPVGNKEPRRAPRTGLPISQEGERGPFTYLAVGQPQGNTLTRCIRILRSGQFASASTPAHPSESRKLGDGQIRESAFSSRAPEWRDARARLHAPSLPPSLSLSQAIGLPPWWLY